MAEAKDYSAAILKAIEETSRGVIDLKAVIDAMMVLTAVAMIGFDEDWTDEALEMLGQAYGQGMTSTLLGMATLKREGGVMPLQGGDRRH